MKHSDFLNILSSNAVLTHYTFVYRLYNEVDVVASHQLPNFKMKTVQTFVITDEINAKPIQHLEILTNEDEPLEITSEITPTPINHDYYIRNIEKGVTRNTLPSLLASLKKSKLYNYAHVANNYDEKTS